MDRRRIEALRTLASRMRNDREQVEARMKKALGRTPDSAIVTTATKYREALERLAAE